MEYEPTRRSVDRHKVPQWYEDAKFGRFIHWSLSCVPAFAPRDRGSIIEIIKKEETHSLFANQPYSEWYLNSLRIKGSPGRVHCDFVTPEYTSFKEINWKKWECVRGMGKSFGYNREEVPEDFITVTELVHLLLDIVSKNGKLLLNVGPMPGGKIPDVQVDILKGIGAWLDVNGEAVFGTRPWVRAEGTTLGGTAVRFTRKDGALYAAVMDAPTGNTITISSLKAREGTPINMLGMTGALEWAQRGEDLEVKLEGTPPDQSAHVLKITPAPTSARMEAEKARPSGPQDLLRSASNG